MALIECVECRSSVSDRAPACPKCGYPIEEFAAAPDRQQPDPVQVQELPVRPRPEPEVRTPAAAAAAAQEPALAEGAICHFSDYGELAAQLGIVQTHVVVRGEETRWTWIGQILLGSAGLVLLVIWNAIAMLEAVRTVQQVIAGISALLVPLFLYLRWHAPRDYMIVHDDRISFVRHVKFERGVGVGEVGSVVPLHRIEKVVYRTSFWKKWLTLVLPDGERVTFAHALLNRRRRMPGVVAARMRTAADLIGYLGVPHRFSYWLAVVTAIYATIFTILSSVDWAAFADRVERERNAALAAPQFQLTRTTNVRSGATASSAVVGQMPEGAVVQGTMVTNASGQPWLRMATGSFTGQYVWARNLREIPAGARSTAPAPREINTAAAAPPTPAPAPAPPAQPTPGWLIGSWAPLDSGCATDTGLGFGADGRFSGLDEEGWWDLVGSTIRIQSRSGILGLEPHEVQALPIERHNYGVVRLADDRMRVTYSNGMSETLRRC